MPAVQVIVTGFGSFHGVPSNPTQRVVSWLQQQYVPGAAQTDAAAPRQLRHGRIHRCTILKVSARAVNTYLTSQLEELKQLGIAACGGQQADVDGGEAPVLLLLHFGVDVHVSHTPL